MRKYKVGDIVKVKEDLVCGCDIETGVMIIDLMLEYRGKAARISKVIPSGYELDIDNYRFTWTEDMLELAEEASHMTAEEVLEWLKKNYYNPGVYLLVFGSNCTYSELFGDFSTDEIVQRIEAYETSKKEVETEFVLSFRIVKCDGSKKIVVEEKTEHDLYPDRPIDCPIQEEIDRMAAEYLKEYCSNHEGKYFCSVTRNCYIKE